MEQQSRPKWTEAQQKAISCRGGTVLVSAAAGSGKTAVLVQRVIDILTDRQNPVDANRILVVTFSNAAAEEMRGRIQTRLNELIVQNPADSYLQRQQTLLSAAHISTVHSFCLELVRANFQLLDIPADFRLGSENEIKLLEEDIAQQTIEQNYENNDGRFSDLVELVSSGRDDKGLQDTLHRLYGFVRSHPFYRGWLDEKLLMYDDTIPVGETVWGKVILQYAMDALRYAQAQLKRAIEEITGDEAMEKAYLSAFEGDLAQAQRIYYQMNTGRWDDVCRELDNVSFQRLGALRGYEDTAKKELVQLLRKSAQNIIKQLDEDLFCVDEAGFLEDIRFLRPRIETLFDLVLDYDRRLMQEKRERRLLDFSDLEHFAVQLLVKEKKEKREKTALAKELSEQFAFVLVDEYQDTNATQDMIFQSVSRPDNLFMVGDVKQSIYRFRQAMPEIFIEKRNTFHDYDGQHYPARIVLSHNFRSRKEVTESINFLFQAVMSREVGEIDYDETEALTAAASYPEKEDAITEVHLLQNASEELSDQLAEASYVAGQIKRMLDEGFTVTESGALRPVRPKDICILLRSMKNRAEIYSDELSKQGIEVWTDAKNGFLESVEISTALSILRAVDNPLIDIQLTAAMMSPVYGFTADDMAVLRLRDRSRHLYLNCQEIAAGENLSEQEKSRQQLCQKFLDSFAQLRVIASASPAHQLIQQLIERTGLWDLVLAMKYGEVRKANLRLLIQYAQEYEAGGQKGIAGFLRFVDKMISRGEDWSCASSVTDRSDAVRIMSVHHSKGLEFPVVFLADLCKSFNRTDSRANVLTDPVLGLGSNCYDPAARILCPTIARQAIARRLDQEAVSEEMRVLYVAMTRPQYRLIMTCCAARLTRRLESYAQGLSLPPDAALLEGADSLGDWILLAAMTRPEAGELFAAAGQPDCALQGGHPWRIQLHTAVQATPEAGTAASAEPACEQPPEPRFLPPYGHAAAVTMPTKLTVTQLKGRELDNEAAEQTAQAPKLHFPVPRFEEGRRALTAAERGTALHLAMQHLNYAACADESGLRSELERLGRQKFLTPQQLEAVDPERLCRFFASPLGQRVLQAPQVVREFKFSVLDDGANYDPALEGEEILLQGVTDCCLIELDGLVILDFKSDRLRPGAERERAEYYRGQLDAYSRALSRIFELPVSERIVYFFATDTAVSL